MSAVSVKTIDRSRKNHAEVLRRLASTGQAEVARQLDTSESTISRHVADHLERTMQILATLGLKVVPQENRCFQPEKIDAILLLAREHLNQAESSQQLAWEDA